MIKQTYTSAAIVFVVVAVLAFQGQFVSRMILLGVFVIALFIHMSIVYGVLSYFAEFIKRLVRYIRDKWKDMDDETKAMWEELEKLDNGEEE